MWVWETVGFLITASVLGSFAFWLIGYFAIEMARHWIRGPSEQLKSLGTSILSEPPLRPVPVPIDRTSRAA
jgi:hypothetical protein